ncbi:helix-turn-helix domain-containing protein [Burkholderia multivorans]|nr:helix-turn-helix transcriptional regulator [Burkholderia multivorans]MBU9583030.1 helix-turn-helix domain-containing protein [Burkholderia multivorans]MCA8458106.1 helix-turn-helix domain-containing protein [Burkholderia multivorans]
MWKGYLPSRLAPGLGPERKIRHSLLSLRRCWILFQNVLLSQEAFADKCGFVRSYMGKIETGKANPSLDSIQTIADALGVPVKTLFEEDGAEGAPSVQD